MENQNRFLAGSFMALADQNKPIEHKARIFLLIESRTKEEALEAATGLVKSPKVITELIFTLSTWPDEIVTIGHEYLDNHFSVKGFSEEGK